MRLLTVLATFAFGAFTTSPTAIAADVLSQWNGGTGDWTELTNWTHTPADLGADYPHNDVLTYDVHFAAGDAFFPVPGEIELNSLSMSGGSLAGETTLTLNQGFRTSGAEIRVGVSQIVMRGTSVWDAATAVFDETYRIFNHGVQELSDIEVSLHFVYGDAAYVNQGLFRKASGTGAATITGDEGPFTSDGTIACDSGTLSFAVPSQIQGHIEAAAGAQVRFVLSTVIMRFLRPTFSGGGSIVFERGPVWMDLAVTNATTMVFEDASMGSEGIVPFENGTFYNQANGVLRLRPGHLGGRSEIGARLINHGQVVLEGPETGFSWGNTILNHGLLRYEDLGDNGLGAHNYSIHNHGVLQFSNTTIDVQLRENRGTIHVSGGTLALSSPGTNFGTLSTSTNGTISWSVPYTFGPGSQLRGNLSALSDTVVAVDTTNHGRLHLAGELTGQGNLFIADGGTLVWAGNISGPGDLILQPGGSLVLAEFGGRLSGATVINESGNTLRWDTGGSPELNSGRILNRGSFEIGHSVTLGPSWNEPARAALENEGTFRIASSNGPVRLHLALTNTGNVEIDSSGLNLSRIYVQTSGHTSIEHGTMTAPDVYILGGDLSVDGALNCELLRVDSSLSLSSTSVVSALLLLTNSSVVEIEIGPTSSGVFHTGLGQTLFTGTIRLRLANGFFPSVGTRYTLFTQVLPAPIFPRYEGLEIGRGLRLAPHFTGSRLDVVVMNAPQPGQKALTLAKVPLQPHRFDLSWPPEFVGFYLQYTTNLSQPTWTTTGLTWTDGVSLSVDGPQTFFRLLPP